MYQRILVPLDGSPLSEQALPHAEELSRRFRAGVILLRAVPSLTQIITRTAPATGAAVGAAPDISLEAATEAYDAETADARAYLAAAASRLEAAGLSVATRLSEDGPAGAILATAREDGADLIVMSTHGRGGLERLVMGSVADEVVRHTTVPVLLIHPAR